VALIVLAAPKDTVAGGGNSFVVDTASDANLTTCNGAVDNDCSLRGAIFRANTSGLTEDFISFDAADFPVATPGVIELGSALPTMIAGNDIISASSRGVIVDAVNTEPGVHLPVR
jgi:hypothetical protein